jgi:NADPH2:quinone reductase
VVPTTAVFPLPPGVDPAEAASVGIAGLTAWGTVVVRAQVGPDDRVLVLGAGGGVGLPTVHLAAASGAEVRGQVGTAAKAAAVRAAGAGVVVVTDASGLTGALGDWHPTVVIDPLGAGFAVASIRHLAPRGRYVSYGTSAGADVTLNLQKDLYRRGIDILGYSGFVITEQERIERTQLVLDALADGRMRIPVGAVRPLTEVQEALDLLSSRSVTGKVVLDLTK